jgi:pyruvate/2-oxoglutarate dehydrogenase complex dihydrolipoamide acyltransferase (E2) component
MAETLPLPKWGLTMEEGMIARWLVQPGDRVEEGTVLATVETDKIENDFESPMSGIVAALLVEAGATVAVGEPIVVIARDEDDLGAYGRGASR